MALKFLLILIILGFWFSGCKRNPAPEVRNLLKDTKIGRLDLDLFRLDTVLPDWGVLQKKYGRYWDTYTIGVFKRSCYARGGRYGSYPIYRYQ